MRWSAAAYLRASSTACAPGRCAASGFTWTGAAPGRRAATPAALAGWRRLIALAMTSDPRAHPGRSRTSSNFPGRRLAPAGHEKQWPDWRAAMDNGDRGQGAYWVGGVTVGHVGRPEGGPGVEAGAGSRRPARFCAASPSIRGSWSPLAEGRGRWGAARRLGVLRRQADRPGPDCDRRGRRCWKPAPGIAGFPSARASCPPAGRCRCGLPARGGNRGGRGASRVCLRARAPQCGPGVPRLSCAEASGGVSPSPRSELGPRAARFRGRSLDAGRLRADVIRSTRQL